GKPGATIFLPCEERLARRSCSILELARPIPPIFLPCRDWPKTCVSCRRGCRSLDTICGCGGHLISARQEINCLKCGVACCPSCSLGVDAATYCARCAESVLDAEGIPLRLSVPAAWIWARSARQERSCVLTPWNRALWVVLVARDQPDLFAHLLGAFARDDKVEIVLDRRK